MKKYSAILLVFILLATACNKGTIDLSTKENTLRGYSVEGIYDVAIGTYSAAGVTYNRAKLRLTINKDSIINEHLELSVEGLPATILANFTPKEGIAPFNSTLVFTLNGIPKPGKYALKLIVKNSSGKTMVYPFTLTVPIVDFEIYSIGEGNFYIYNNDKNLYLENLSVVGTGILDTINLSYLGLPKGVEAQFTENNKMPDFSTYVSFETKKVTNGTYPISLIAKTNSGIIETVYERNLIITDNCAYLIPETYAQSLRYEGGILIDNVDYSVKILASSNPSYFYFQSSTYDNSKRNVFNFYFNCNDNSIIVPKQNGFVGTKDVIIEGVGTFNPTTKEIIIDCVLDNTLNTRFVISK